MNMNKELIIAEKTLLEPAGISETKLAEVVGSMLGKNIDYADCYFQSTQRESWYLEDGIVKQGDFSLNRGVGVRALSHEKTGFAYSDDIILTELEHAAQTAKAIASRGGAKPLHVLTTKTGQHLYPLDNPLISLDEEAKVALLHEADCYARKRDPRVKQVMASIAGSHSVVLIMTSDGQLAADIRPLVRMSVSVVVEEKGCRETAMAGGGGRHDYHFFVDENKAQAYAEEAVRQALVNLQAKPAPAGEMTVVLGPGWPGVLLHEAIGHGLEGDFNRKGSSAFSGRLGQRIATQACTVVDNGCLAGRRGSLNIDDEGTQTQCTTLIDRGVLRNTMQDKLNARLMGQKSTGNGRRESYAHLPIPRMTNTYMLPGKYNPEEIIASVRKGIYAVNFSGGQVDITSGKFAFSMNEAYLIENGKITAPVKGATLIGDGPDVLTKVIMVGSNLQFDPGIGICGKEGQNVPVGVGQPTLRIDGITVGGLQ